MLQAIKDRHANGLYKFNRIPFGIKIAPAIFHQVMETMLENSKVTVPYLDDIFIKIDLLLT